jgi:hypothetical protein
MPFSISNIQHHDTHHYDIQHNDIQDYGILHKRHINWHLALMTLSIMAFSKATVSMKPLHDSTLKVHAIGGAETA